MQTIVHLVENDWAGCGFTFLILDRECLLKVNLGLPWWLSSKVAICQCSRHGFDPWLGKIPHATEQLSQSVTATEPVLWSRRTATTESSCRSCWGLFTLECEDFAMKSPRTANREHASLSATREKPTQQCTHSTAKNKNK